jgi:hypothetical protein
VYRAIVEYFLAEEVLVLLVALPLKEAILVQHLLVHREQLVLPPY